jgi:hypothetical protein
LHELHDSSCLLVMDYYWGYVLYILLLLVVDA